MNTSSNTISHTQDDCNPVISEADIARFIGANETAKILGITRVTLWTYRKNGTGPRFYKVGPKHILYRPADIEAWLQARRRTRAA